MIVALVARQYLSDERFLIHVVVPYLQQFPPQGLQIDSGLRYELLERFAFAYAHALHVRLRQARADLAGRLAGGRAFDGDRWRLFDFVQLQAFHITDHRYEGGVLHVDGIAERRSLPRAQILQQRLAISRDRGGRIVVGRQLDAILVDKVRGDFTPNVGADFRLDDTGGSTINRCQLVRSIIHDCRRARNVFAGPEG